MIDWVPPVSVATSTGLAKFWTAPPITSTSAKTNESGSRIRTVARVRSTQKLPSRSVWVRTNPRISPTATARPTAADTKFWTARPAICTRWPMVASPEYHCQFVFVTNETAVLKAPAGGTPGKSSDSGR